MGETTISMSETTISMGETTIFMGETISMGETTNKNNHINLKTFIFETCYQLILKHIGKVHLVFHGPLHGKDNLCEETHITDTQP